MKQHLGIKFMILALLGLDEYGHILWCDEETESQNFMNKTGNYKILKNSFSKQQQVD